MIKQKVLISNNQGVHARIAAEIVQKTDIIKEKFKINLFIKKMSDTVPIAISMLALLSLRIKQNDIIEISCIEDNESGSRAVTELCDFIKVLMKQTSTFMDNIDDIIEQSTIANEQILESLSAGVVVVDQNSSVVQINKYALNIINKSIKEVTGKKIEEIIPNIDMHKILNRTTKEINTSRLIYDKELIIRVSPIYTTAKIVIGAVAVFQDVSELESIKELNQKLSKILESSGDLICFVDEDRKINYMNPAFKYQFPKEDKEALGKDLIDISPDGLRMKVFNSREKVENLVYQKEGLDMICNVEPLFINDEFKGIISISRPVNQIKNILIKLEHSQEELNYYKEELFKRTNMNNSFNEIIGASGSLQDSLFIAEKASKSISTVLIRGESGTGKELIANAIHANSERKNKPFVRVNCAAIPENLLESELFGYEKGAFTGALKSKPGKFSVADGGTIFLDEIGDMPKSMQVKLLRVLQEKEFESVGGIDTKKVDVRVIAATNRNLEEMMDKGEFREDLYYRLNVMTIMLPALKDRKEDINLLIEYFIKKMNSKLNKAIKGINKEALIYLQEYNWPGNIRELENVIERAMNMCEEDIISSKDLPVFLTNITSQSHGLVNLVNGDLLPIEEYEKEIIRIAMEKHKSYNAVGKVLGLTHRTVALKCQKYGIEH